MKRTCFDTTVIVAGLLGQHPRHAEAFGWLREVQEHRREGVLTAHGLAECFATLTALPIRPRLPAGEVHQLLEYSIIAHFEVQTLSAGNYREALAMAAQRGFGSGAIYDALHLVGARAAGCERLLTFNLRHFELLAPGDPLLAQAE